MYNDGETGYIINHIHTQTHILTFTHAYTMENPNKQVEIWLFTYVFAVYCIKLLTILVAVVPTVTSAAAVEVDVVAVIINKCYSDSR